MAILQTIKIMIETLKCSEGLASSEDTTENNYKNT